LRDETKIQAIAHYRETAEAAEQAMMVFEKDFTKNVLDICIRSPTLILPFKQKSQKAID